MHEASVKVSNWDVVVGGFRDVLVDDVEGLLLEVGEAVGASPFQLFEAGRSAGWEHIYFAAVNAVRAHEEGAAISRGLAMEVLLYVACVDQISQALDVVGVSSSTERVGLLVMSLNKEEATDAFKRASDILGVVDDSVLAVDGRKLEAITGVYGVSDVELDTVCKPRKEALTWVIVERGALLPLRR
jgi:tRNA threonylcarbamoyladenosine modification (KEOPS) complex Cgi121 subunit